MSPVDAPEAWIKLPTEDDIRAAAPPGAVHPYVAYLGGVVARMARLLAAHPLIGPAFRELSRAIMFAPGALTRMEREAVAAVAASAQGCVY